MADRLSERAMQSGWVRFFNRLMYGFFAFWGRLKRLIAKLILPVTVKSSYDIRRRQGLQRSGHHPRPPPLQTGINAKILKISPEW